LHRGCDTKQIDRVGCLHLVGWWQAYILEKPLAPAAIILVRLSRQFLAVESEERPCLFREVAVVICGRRSRAHRLCGTERNTAISANTPRCVKMNSAALHTLEVHRPRSSKA